jgi:flagellar protein FliO/FliZ
MSTTLNAVVMLGGTLAVFGLLAALAQAVRTRRFGLPRSSLARLGLPPLGRAVASGGKRLLIEEVCAIDPRRRLVLIRCDGQRVLLLTGGPADMVLAAMPDLAPPAGPA